MRGSIATTLPDLAWCCSTIFSSSCSATNWIRESMVRWTSWPGCGSVSHAWIRSRASAHPRSPAVRRRWPCEFVVQALLDAAVAVLFEIHAADARAPPASGSDKNAGSRCGTRSIPASGRAAACRFLGRDLALHPEKTAAVVDGRFQLAPTVRRDPGSGSGKNVGGHRRVGHAQRIDAHRFHRQAHRQPLPMPVQNRAARGA